jgi:hypothetical protein
MIQIRNLRRPVRGVSDFSGGELDSDKTPAILPYFAIGSISRFLRGKKVVSATVIQQASMTDSGAQSLKREASSMLQIVATQPNFFISHFLPSFPHTDLPRNQA